MKQESLEKLDPTSLSEPLYGKLKTRGKSYWNWVPSQHNNPAPPLLPPPCPMSLFSTISVRRSGEERFVRNTYLAQRQSPVPTPFISPGDGIQYTKTPSCSSITPALGIRAGLPGNWLVVDEHKVWDYPWRSGDYRKGWRDCESLMGGCWQCFSTSPFSSTQHPYPTCSFNLQPHKYTCVLVWVGFFCILE